MDSENEAAQIEEVNSSGLHNLIVELENVNTNSSQGSEKPSDGEVQDNGASINGNCCSVNSCDKDPTGADSSSRKEEVDDIEKPDRYSPEKPSDEEPTGAGSPKRKKLVSEEEKPDKCASEKPSDGEVQDNRGSIYGNCTGANSCVKEPSGAESFNRKEEVDDKEKPGKCSPKKPSDAELAGADISKKKEEEVDDKVKHDEDAFEKPSDREVQDNSGSIYGNCTGANSCGKKPTGADSFNRKEEVDGKEKPDKYSPEKPSDGEPNGADSTGANSCGKEPTGADSFNRKEEVDGKEKPDRYSPEKPSDGVLTGADSSKRKEEVDGKEKPDKYSLERPSDGEANGADSSNRKEEVDDPTGADSSKRKEEVDGKEEPDKYSLERPSDGEANGADSSNRKEEVDDKEKPDKYSPEKPSDGEPTGADSSNRKEEEVDDKEKPDKCADKRPTDGEVQNNRGNIYGSCTGGNSCGKEPTEADSFKRKEEVDDKEKPDKCCDITNSNTICFSADAGASKMTSAEELQISSNFPSKRQKMDVDGIAIPCPTRGGKNKNDRVPIRVYHHQKKKTSVESVAGSPVVVTRCDMETNESMKSNGNEFIDGKIAGTCIQGPISSPPNDIPAADCALVPYEPNASDVEKVQTVLTTKETEISETALRVLLQKREEMCHQQRILEDKIALCSRDIRKIIDGDEDALALKLEAMIDCCNDTCLKGRTQIEGEIHQGDFQRTGQCSRRNRLPDAILTFQSPCQELDDICRVNNWRLPRYSVSASTGGFVANITVKEMDFDFSCDGALLSTPHAARDSAAARVVAKLREI